MSDDNFFDYCEKNNIKIIEGAPHKILDSDFALAGPEALFDYCSANAITSIIIDVRYSKNKQLKMNELKDKLWDRYRSLILRYYPLNTLPDTVNEDAENYYMPAWNETWSELESEIKSESLSNETEEELSHIEGWIIDKGLRLHATIFEEESSEEGKNVLSSRKLLEKYGYALQMRMQKLRKDADIEHERILREKKDQVLKEIAEFVKNDSVLKYMDTQKSRNEYADRLYIVWQQEKGASWLTKKEVRSIVDLEYVHIT